MLLIKPDKNIFMNILQGMTSLAEKRRLSHHQIDVSPSYKVDSKNFDFSFNTKKMINRQEQI